jgi:hypothetical protein
MFHDRTSQYQAIVRQIKDVEYLEGIKLKSRLKRVREKLTSSTESKTILFGAFSNKEQVIPWIEDRQATNCHICKRRFHKVLRRKHHCRACGNVICNLCSNFMDLLGLAEDYSSGINVIQMAAEEKRNETTRPQGVALKTRVCIACIQTLQHLDNRQPMKEHLDDFSSIYQDAMQIRRKIDEFWPFFLNLLNELAM